MHVFTVHYSYIRIYGFITLQDLDEAITYVRSVQQTRQFDIDTERPVFGKIALPNDIRTRGRSVIVELCCNCDFVTSSDKFAQLAHNIRKTIQRSIDINRINIDHSDTSGAIVALDIGSCNDLKCDDVDGITVGQMLQQSSAEFKTKIVMSTVLAFVTNLQKDHIGVYVHQKEGKEEGVMGSILGMVSLRHHGVNSALSNQVSDTLADIAKHLAIQMVCSPLEPEQSQAEGATPYRMVALNDVLQQPWMHLDFVQSKMRDLATQIGIVKLDVAAEAPVGKTLGEIAKLIGASSISVPGALYMKSGATPVICA
ncbi:elongation factor Ts [Babesia ovata]|uniref:Elongation factor Ts n=1 Tax=Babesia ovata TaxID=189622 RepID=A0A2H6K6D8_9APIC|nr:elongation factor Ts [Babesia ovata]GBE58555.1 elongation factor Ts [Babesia ovata]